MRRARLHRALEPSLLLLLAERPTHGYELLAELPDVLGSERVDVGNVYRSLRGLEERSLVVSEWRDDLPGPAKRTYEITNDGRAALERWAESLREARDRIDDFIRRYESGGARSASPD